MLVLLSGVSGAGKDTIKKELIARMDNVESLPSFTDRAPRENDIPGKTYNFVSTEEFEAMIDRGELYEYSAHHNHYYGTSRKLLNEKMQNGKIIVKDIELRLNRLQYEESKIGIYDYVIKNNNLEKTVNIIMEIIKSEYNMTEAEF